MTKQKLLIQSLRLLFVVALFTSCNNIKKQPDSDENNETHNQHKDANHEKPSHATHGFTDKVTVEELTKRFESSERDSVEQPQKIVQFLGEIQNKTILDIGAGTGYYAVRFADKGAKVIAADVSDQFQDYLKQRIEKNNIKNIELRKTPYDSPLLKDGEVDIVFIANTYHHIENRTEYFAKVKKGLIMNGELIVLDYFNVDFPKGIMAPPMKMRVSVDQAVFELKKAGFTTFEVEVNALPYHYIIKAK
ncbi:class I SAM-dependent methyltransferase [Flavobacterium jejuense]|uniref:Class I SAM-dependent methyltransferase n=1 Tax=Flavobacterium jejuense TaxID=1544455 RepID=A0ABX0INH8_9FLAO|nr:class I SAM-dependent methyltransferase [Flavobacterium jejuense]NHN25253.1 class I SAM-dependent methyltransferase [Flavobacterium jejuense]